MNLDWITPADRLSALPPYVFARLDELKARAREQGLDLIDLGMGNPDGATPQPGSPIPPNADLEFDVHVVQVVPNAALMQGMQQGAPQGVPPEGAPPSPQP